MYGPGAVDFYVRLGETDPKPFLVTSSHRMRPPPSLTTEHHCYYIVKVNPKMSESKIKLALAYTQHADIQRKSGDLKPAIESYKRAAAIYLELSQEEPAVLEMLAQTIEAAAVTYKDAGDFENAKETQAEAVKVREQMAKLEA